MTDGAHSAVRVHRDVAFAERESDPLALDVYEPPQSGPRPVAVLVRGGAFRSGDKGELARYALDFAADGYVAVEPQYRLAPDHRFPAALVDVKAAIEWVRTAGESYGADPSRVGAVGHSAGANLVTLAAATADDPAFEPDLYPGASSELDAVAGLAGVYDFAALAEQVGDDEVQREYLGTPVTEDREVADLASPAAQADLSMPPTLLLHGEDDEVVPSEQSTLFHDVLDPLTDVELELVDADHAFPFDGEEHDGVSDRLTEFFGARLSVPDARSEAERGRR